MYSPRTDLAIEARAFWDVTGHELDQELFDEKKQALINEFSGIEVETETVDKNIKITRIGITNEKASKEMGREIGKYITLEIPRSMDGSQETYESVCRVFSKELGSLINLNDDDTVLVIGLGNWNITADALGPRVVEEVMITRHLIEYMPEEIDEGLRPVCALSPGVLGITGIETGEIVKGLVEKVKPALVIAIDALCSRSIERINTTIQLADTGITPGAGIGNRRMALNRTNLGVPVIAVGVPTVVDAATIADDSIELVLSLLKEQLKNSNKDTRAGFEFLTSMDRQDRYEMIKQVISPVVGDLIVAPKDVDTAINDIADVIANGINISLHKSITADDIDRYK